MATADRETINRETDARFAAQSGVGRKLDPKNPADKALIKTWQDINAKVKAEAAAGTLVTTFDHPTVMQHLAEADAANQVAETHLDAATKTADPVEAQQHEQAATAAASVSADKAKAAAALQPPSVTKHHKRAAAHSATQSPPPLHATAKHRLAHKQIQAAGTHAHPRDILMRETDARFWATGYRPGHKLDPHDSVDATMLPVWEDIFRKVKAEDASGNLVITYNHPVVAQNLSDAHVADKAAQLHLEAAAAQPETAPQNIAAAATASQVSAQKTNAVAKLQPPSVSAPLAHTASQQAARAPVGAGHTVAQHLAQAQARNVGGKVQAALRHHRKHRRPVRSTVPPGSLRNYRMAAARFAHAAGAPYVLVMQRPDGSVDRQAVGSRADLEAAYAKISEAHGQYRYVGAFDLTSNRSAPVHDSVGVPAAEHADVPPEVPAPSSDASSPSATLDTRGTSAPQDAPPGSGSPLPSAALTVSPNKSPAKTSFGKVAAIFGAVAAAGGLIYAGAFRNSKKASSSGGRSRRAAPVLVEPLRLARMKRG